MDDYQAHPEELDARTRLASIRTALASERTLMAWIRTDFSIITFGFSIYKFFQYLNTALVAHAPVAGPRRLGLSLIALGIVSLVAAIWQHWSLLKRLSVGGMHFSPWRTPAVIIALLMAALGLWLFVALFFKLPYI